MWNHLIGCNYWFKKKHIFFRRKILEKSPGAKARDSRAFLASTLAFIALQIVSKNIGCLNFFEFPIVSMSEKLREFLDGLIFTTHRALCRTHQFTMCSTAFRKKHSHEKSSFLSFKKLGCLTFNLYLHLQTPWQREAWGWLKKWIIIFQFGNLEIPMLEREKWGIATESCQRREKIIKSRFFRKNRLSQNVQISIPSLDLVFGWTSLIGSDSDQSNRRLSQKFQKKKSDCLTLLSCEHEKLP